MRYVPWIALSNHLPKSIAFVPNQLTIWVTASRHHFEWKYFCVQNLKLECETALYEARYEVWSTFFLPFRSSGTCVWVQASRCYFWGSVLERTSFSCTFGIHCLETVLLNIVMDWQEQFWTRPFLQSFVTSTLSLRRKPMGLVRRVSITFHSLPF